MQFIRTKTASVGANVDDNQVRGSRRLGIMSVSELSRSGFTLVEIIIVLAIVGLIFVIIFLAVAAASKGRRDTARKDTVNRMFAAIQASAGNNNGTFPNVQTCAATPCNFFAVGVAGATFQVSLNAPVVTVAAAPTKTAVGWSGAACATGTLGGTTRVEITLEDGGNYCKDY